MLALSCVRQEPDQPGTGTETTSWPGYVFFGADIATKTPIITSMNGRNFGVVAFKYSSDWATFKATGTPASSGFACPTTVSCNASTGVCTYSPVKQWEDGQYYSFFAYYPVGNSSVVLGSTTTTAGAPVLTYTVPSWTDPSALQDVMTASAIDTDNSGDGVVPFTFRHRLCCLDVEARNLNENPETIKNLKLNITSSVYTSVSVPVDGSALTPSGNKTGGIAYQVVADSEAAKVTIPVMTGGMSSATTNVSGDNNIILIPQTVAVKGHLEGSISFTDKNGTSKSQEFDSDKDFEAGKKYTFIITFANETITIAVIESGEWIDSDQDIIFE